MTKSGKILSRKSGQNHFNAKERKHEKGAKNRSVEFHISNKSASRYLVNL